jgi:glutaredoxin-related protein
MNNYKMAKPELYFSKYCKFSTKIIEQLNKNGVDDKFIYISIDKRFTKNNVTYIFSQFEKNYAVS